MGIFSSKIITTVSSVAYNLAGDSGLTPDIRKTVIIGSVLSGDTSSIGSSLIKANAQGPGMKQRRFLTWAKNNFVYGMPTAHVGAPFTPDTDLMIAGLKTIVPLAQDEFIEVYAANIDDADTDYWAEDYIRTYRPELDYEDWTALFNSGNNTISISIGGEGDTVIPAPADMLWGLDRQNGRKILFIVYAVHHQDPDTLNITIGPDIMHTYRMGSGNVSFDSQWGNVVGMSEFYPVMPVRLHNEGINIPGREAIYTSVNKGFKKLTGTSVDQLIDQIDDNPDVAHIDHAFVVQGVSLNTEETMCKEYLYKFFLELAKNQNHSKEEFDVFAAEYAANGPTTVTQTSYWKTYTPKGSGNPGDDKYRPPVDTTPVRVLMTQNVRTPNYPPPETELRVRSPALAEYDMRIRWNYIKETQHAGNINQFDGVQRDLAPVGTYWFVGGGTFSHKAFDYSYKTQIAHADEVRVTDVFTDQNLPRMYMLYQHDRWRYSKIEILGLTHTNYVYGSHTVHTTCHTALEDTEESDFIIPLHDATFKGMGISKNNQMASSTSYLVFNVIEQRKQRWYEKGIFKFILAIIAVVLTVVTGGAFGGAIAASGILGSSVAVGLALGASAATALIVGAIANAVAGMIVSMIIQKASMKIFGGKLGAIIGTVLSFVAMTFAANFAATGSFSIDWGNIFSADNLLGLTNSVTDAYTKWLNMDTSEIYGKMEDLENEYEDKLDEIQKMSNEILGMTNHIIDPMMFTDATEYFGESSETFLGRTLLTGSDIAELSFGLVHEFVPTSLQLDKAVT